MRKPRAFLIGEPGSAHFYHVVSRVAGREILFGDKEREAFVALLFKQLGFSGLKAVAWCFPGNHFHLLLEVPDKESSLKHWTGGKRGATLRRKKFARGEREVPPLEEKSLRGADFLEMVAHASFSTM